MSYIAPNTDIVLCTNVPLENSYDHTLTFANVSAQQTYFASKAYKTITSNSYQRAMRNKLRIACTMDEAVRCNYLYFKNTSFENKYFYAFITGWEYINNITTEITYELDVFQSFFFDIDIKPSFVEREHSNTDVIGENLVPEGLEQGEYIVMRTDSINLTAIENYVSASGCILMLCTVNDDAECTKYNGGFLNYVFSGLNPIVKTNVNDLQTFLTKLYNKTGSLDAIVSAFMCPFTPLVSPATSFTWDLTVVKNYSLTLDGYTPKNNKLFTSPYYTFRVRSDVAINEYPFEYFSGANADFELVALLIPEPVLVLIPKNFKRYTSNAQKRLDLRMTIQNFPQCSFDSDVYKVYLAQNAASLRASIIGDSLQKFTQIGQQLAGSQGSAQLQYNGNTDQGDLTQATGALSAIGTAVDWHVDMHKVLAQMEDIKIRPPELNGTQTCLNDYAVGAKNFYGDIVSIRAEFARIIDDYFNMFGYATHRVKVPNITGRPHWNYVKTKAVVLDVANAPQPYIQKLTECLNKGITFWHNPSEVGNYNLDNRPV